MAELQSLIIQEAAQQEPPLAVIPAACGLSLSELIMRTAQLSQLPRRDVKRVLEAALTVISSDQKDLKHG